MYRYVQLYRGCVCAVTNKKSHLLSAFDSLVKTNFEQQAPGIIQSQVYVNTALL